MKELILLQAQQGQGNNIVNIGFMVAIVAILYLFMVRPQQKKAKAQKKFVNEVKKGDQVVTIGGMHGRVAEVSGNTVMLEVEKGGRIKFNRSAISMESTQALSGQQRS